MGFEVRGQGSLALYPKGIQRWSKMVNLEAKTKGHNAVLLGHSGMPTG